MKPQTFKKPTRRFDSVSHNFKIAMVALIFFLAIFRLADILYLPVFNPDIDLIPDTVPLGVVVFIVIYLWIQEIMDYSRLLKLNESLEAAHEELKQAEIDTIAALIKAEEEKDLYTSGHSERVTMLSHAIADEMNLDDEFTRSLLRAGVLHDIGKIGISDAILLKKEKLLDSEWDVIKCHPQKGVEILKPLKFLTAESKIILHHHERYDGSGYPSGLKKDEIPLGAQILAVADTFDAMNSERAYRKTLSREDIISELNKSRSTQHSAEIIDVFLKVLEINPLLWNR